MTPLRPLPQTDEKGRSLKTALFLFLLPDRKTARLVLFYQGVFPHNQGRYLSANALHSLLTPPRFISHDRAFLPCRRRKMKFSLNFKKGTQSADCGKVGNASRFRKNAPARGGRHRGHQLGPQVPPVRVPLGRRA